MTPSLAPLRYIAAIRWRDRPGRIGSRSAIVPRWLYRLSPRLADWRARALICQEVRQAETWEPLLWPLNP